MSDGCIHRDCTLSFSKSDIVFAASDVRDDECRLFVGHASTTDEIGSAIGNYEISTLMLFDGEQNFVS